MNYNEWAKSFEIFAKYEQLEKHPYCACTDRSENECGHGTIEVGLDLRVRDMDIEDVTWLADHGWRVVGDGMWEFSLPDYSEGAILND